MPTHLVKEGGEEYAQWGEHGKKYPAKGKKGLDKAISKANKQGRAIKASEARQMTKKPKNPFKMKKTAMPKKKSNGKVAGAKKIKSYKKK